MAPHQARNPVTKIPPGLMVMVIVLSLIIVLPASATAGEPMAAEPNFAAQEHIRSTLGNLSLFFVPNEGQTDPAVLFTCEGKGFTVYYTRDRVVTSTLPAGEKVQTVVSQRFAGANQAPVVEGLDALETMVSYFTGPESEWHTGITPFGAIVYRDLYPGIDLVYRGDRGAIKREFVVCPGADPYQIRIQYEGAGGVRVSGDGFLIVKAGTGEIQETPPVCYQESGGERVEIPCRFDLQDDGSVIFFTGWYDRTLPLMIDPSLAYCGYIGGSGADTCYGIAVDSSGNAYVTGGTRSDQTTFPETVGPDLTHNGGDDAFVAKINAAGTGLVYCGYIGGTGDEEGRGIAVDSTGSAYITGHANSDESTFPVTPSWDPFFNGGTKDAFVAKVFSTGTDLGYCGYIGGLSADDGYDIAVDNLGYAYVTGYTYSSEATFPVKTGPDLTHNSGTDTFVAKISPVGDYLVYCGYIGGTGFDYGYGIAVDGTGNAYIAGRTGSDQTSFPETIGPDLTYNGLYDVFVAKVNTAGTGLVYCGYIGGTGDDEGYDTAVDGAGNAYVTGRTYSDQASFPETVGPDLTFNGGYNDAFVARVNAAGTGLSYCGYIGGSGADTGYGIAVDGTGNAYVTGTTASDQTSFPVMVGPDITHNGNIDTFMARVNAAGTGLSYCGYIGGSPSDEGHNIAVDSVGNAYVTGSTPSDQTTFPVKAGPDLTFNGGSGDAFVAKVPHEFGRGVFRSSVFNNWILDRSMDGTIDIRDHYGSQTDIPLIGDFNSDGKADRAVFRAGEWIMDYSTDGSVNLRNQYGMTGDIPLVGRMNNDPGCDRAVFRNGEWIIDYDMNIGVDVRNHYGSAGDIPLIGNFNNDGIPDRAVFRPSAWDNWIIDYNMDGSVNVRNHYGSPGDIPVVGDFNNDGLADRAVFRNGEWIIDYDIDGSVNARPMFGWKGDIPLVWDG